MYSQSTVIAGGLAHIPVVIGVFSFIQKFFSKRASQFPQDTEEKKSPVKTVEQKPAPKPAPVANAETKTCLLYTSPSPRDMRRSRMPSSA